MTRMRAWRWLAFASVGFIGAIAIGFLLYLVISYALHRPPVFIGLVLVAVLAYDQVCDRSVPFLATDNALKHVHVTAVQTVREYVVPGALLVGLSYAAYQIIWLGHLRGALVLAVLWIADLVIAWTVRHHMAWVEYRRSVRRRPAGAAMLDDITTDPEGNQ
jgi:predicted membrane-bound spermidine synthase